MLTSPLFSSCPVESTRGTDIRWQTGHEFESVFRQMEVDCSNNKCMRERMNFLLGDTARGEIAGLSAVTS